MKRPTRRDLREIADELGYTPGKFTLQRTAETSEMLQQWSRYYRDGEVPPDFTDMEFEEWALWYRSEVREIVASEIKLLEYCYPKMRAHDVQAEHKGNVQVELVQYGGVSDGE